MLTVKQLAERCDIAYSTDNYNHNWLPSVKMLRKRGYTDGEIVGIIRSKLPRWAADSSNKPYGKNNSADLARYMDRMRPQDLRDLVDECKEEIECPDELLKEYKACDKSEEAVVAIYDRMHADDIIRAEMEKHDFTYSEMLEVIENRSFKY